MSGMTGGPEDTDCVAVTYSSYFVTFGTALVLGRMVQGSAAEIIHVRVEHVC